LFPISLDKSEMELLLNPFASECYSVRRNLWVLFLQPVSVNMKEVSPIFRF